QEPQVVHGAASCNSERPLCVRSEREGINRAVPGHRRPALQATEGRSRLRQQPERAHVAHAGASGQPAVTRPRATAETAESAEFSWSSKNLSVLCELRG